MNAITETNFDLDAAAVSDRGLNEKRPYNEDSFLEIAAKGLFAVADGVGGAQAGDVASQMAVEILGEAFVHYADTVDAEEIMKVAIERANTAIHQMASDLPQLSSMATTVVALHLSGNIATIAHVGDSRLYHTDTDGNLFRDTNDHSVVEEEVRAGRMTPEQALNHPSRNVISRALGAEAEVLIDQKTIMVEPGTVFLLCSDGVTRHITDEEIAGLLTTGMSSAMICDQIKEICHSRGAEDNLTAVVIKLKASSSKEQQIIAVSEPPTDDFETVISSRSPFDSPAANADISTSENSESNSANSETSSNIELEESDYNSSSVVVKVGNQTSENEEFSIFGNTAQDSVKVLPQEQRPGKSMNLLNSLLWLLVGAIAGVGGYYFWQSTNPVEIQQQTIISPKTADIVIDKYEETRRKVDSDPDSFVLSAGSVTPLDAVDFYYLGRALLLTGKGPEARQQFMLAKEKLAEADEKIRDTLAVDVYIAVALTNTPQGTEILRKELAEMNQAQAANKMQDNTDAVNNEKSNAATNADTDQQ